MKTDLFKNIPKIGDIIIWNPAQYKGVMWGKVCSIGKTGNPQINEYGGEMNERASIWIDMEINKRGFYSIRTNFVIK